MFSLDVDTTVANQIFSTTLDGANYFLRLLWNERDEAFYIDLYDSTQSAIWLGQRVVVGWRLWAQCVDPRKPPGELMAIDTTNQDEDPTLTVADDGSITSDLGDRVKLIYFTGEELASVTP